MKKSVLCAMLLITFLLSSFFVTVADTTELYHYDSLDPEIVKLLSDGDGVIKLFVKRYLEKHYLPEGETADESKITYDLTKIHTTYQWNNTDISDFLRTEDKGAFLKNLEHLYYSFPVFYNGTLLEDYTATALYNEKENMLYMKSHDYPSSRYTWSNYYIRKDRTDLSLKELKIEGYEVVQTAHLSPYDLDFVLVEKSGQYFAAYMNQRIRESDPFCQFIEKREPELIQKRVLTADEVDQLLSHYDDYRKTIPSTAEDLEGGGTLKKEPFNPWIILGAVILAGGLVTMLLIKKKNKTAVL